MARPTPAPPLPHPLLGTLAQARAVWTMGLGALLLGGIGVLIAVQPTTDLR